MKGAKHLGTVPGPAAGTPEYSDGVELPNLESNNAGIIQFIYTASGDATTGNFQALGSFNGTTYATIGSVFTCGTADKTEVQAVRLYPYMRFGGVFVNGTSGDTIQAIVIE
jgi:hypothetical protein